MDTQKTRQSARHLNTLTLMELDAMRRTLEMQAQMSEDSRDAHDHLLSHIDDEIAARPIVTFADIALKCRAILQRRDLDFDPHNRGASAQMLLQIANYAVNQTYSGDPTFHRSPKT
jgi:hypothetical protein